MSHDPNRKYRELADPAHWSAHFRRTGRDVWEHREQLLAYAGLRPGMTTMDVGAGTGAFAELLLGRVGAAGCVHAVEVVDHFVARLVELSARHPNLLVHASPGEVASGSVDVALCIDTYHHLSEPEPVLQATARALAPDGVLLFVDLRVDEHSSRALREHVRADQATVERELEHAGLRVVSRPPPLPENYVLRLRRA